MITNEDRTIIVDYARKYHAAKVLLFGSSASPEADSQDIDLGVEGVSPRNFFLFYADLLLSLSKPVDLVDLGNDSAFNAIVRRDGIPLYG